MNEFEQARWDNEQANSTPVKDVPWKEEQPSAASFLHKGDLVHARLELQPKEGEVMQPLVTEFEVSGVNGSRVYGSVHHPEGLSQHDGWRFELLRTHEVMPTTLSEIDAEMRTGSVLRLMGKGSTWVVAETGASVDVNDIVQFKIV